ncbi:hypothetical protein ABZX72_02575 [Streptomyces cyaneofuscatus]|uniref:hypothetical protein n=1 Tax=Streptomyces cyaneofuscatus TaxID=66883 RepID=UPI0033B70DBD
MTTRRGEVQRMTAELRHTNVVEAVLLAGRAGTTSGVVLHDSASGCCARRA